MDTPTAIAIIGGVALLIAIIGGGIEVKEIVIPRIPNALRLLSFLLGLVCIGIAIILYSKPAWMNLTNWTVSAVPTMPSPSVPPNSVTPIPTAVIPIMTVSPTGRATVASPVATTPPVPQLRYPPVTLNEPQDGQSIRDFKVVFEWRAVQSKLVYGDSYQVFYRLVGSSDWQYTSDRVGAEVCSANGICSKEVRPLRGGYGKYFWTVFVVDGNGTVVSRDAEIRKVDWINPSD
jgi:hypothetical protein